MPDYSPNRRTFLRSTAMAAAVALAGESLAGLQTTTPAAANPPVPPGGVDLPILRT